MSGTVNNGSRVSVVHDAFAGQAGLVETDGQIQISFPFKGNNLPSGTVSIDGVPYRIDAVRKSAISTPLMIVLTVSAVTEGEAQP
jgi:hypothetical protein